MSASGRVRFRLLAVFLVAALPPGASCYRAEIDLTPLLDDKAQPDGGVLAAGGAGESAIGGNEPAPAAGGAAGAPTCDRTPDAAAQYQCRLRPPAKQACDEEDSPGWQGCYDGGCAICTEVIADYPYYLARHPCCIRNDTCSVHAPRKCSPLCPPPTELDKLPPCYELER